MKNIYLIEWLIIAGISSIIALAFISASVTTNDFKTVCDSASGTTVFDGRQYQCIKPKV